MRRLRVALRTHGYPLLILGLAVIASWLTMYGWHGARLAGHPGQATGVVTYSTDTPDESAITPADYTSTATGTDPAYISLPTIKAGGYVQPVGVDQHNQMAVPTNIHLAGWFVDAVKPGDPGLSIIDGHIDGAKYPGIFEHLGAIQVGDSFLVRLANNTTQHYVVRAVQTATVADAASILYSQQPGITRQLNLITCGGTYNRSAGGYAMRVIVTAEYTGQSK